MDGYILPVERQIEAIKLAIYNLENGIGSSLVQYSVIEALRTFDMYTDWFMIHRHFPLFTCENARLWSEKYGYKKPCNRPKGIWWTNENDIENRVKYLKALINEIEISQNKNSHMENKLTNEEIILVLQEAKKKLTIDRPINYGVCNAIADALKERSIKITFSSDIERHIPIFNFDNARTACREKHVTMPTKNLFWWNRENITSRIAFINWMIQKLQEEPHEITINVDYVVSPSDEELLAKAKEMFPIGTIFKPAHTIGFNDYEKIKSIITNTNFKVSYRQGGKLTVSAMTDENSHWSSQPKYGNCCWDREIYYDGKWAKIIETPYVFPEKWFIRTNAEINSILVNWRGGGYSGKLDQVCLTSFRCWEFLDMIDMSEYTEIRIGEFKEHVLDKTDVNQSFKVTRKQFKLLHEVSCSDWKIKIKKLVEEYIGLFTEECELPYRVVKTMHDAIFTPEQRQAFNSIFPDFVD